MSLAADILYDTLDDTPGSLMAGIIGVDGLSVEMVAYEDDLPYDRYAVEAELSVVVANISQSVHQLSAKPVQDVIIQTEELTYLLSRIIPGYYAVLGVETNGGLGRSRYALHELVDRLLDEL